MKIIVSTLLALLMLASPLPLSWANSSRTIVTNADSFIWAYKLGGSIVDLGVTRGSWDNLYIMNDSLRYDYCIAYLRFDLSTLPANITVLSATLSAHTVDGHIVNKTRVYVHYCADNSWNESTLLWNNAPSFNSDTLDSVVVEAQYPSLDGKWYAWNVVSATNATLGRTDKQLTLVLTAEEVAGGSNYYIPFFFSREAEIPGRQESMAPKLTVTYSEELPIGVIAGVAAASFITIVCISVFLHRRARSKKDDRARVLIVDHKNIKEH
jgi:hypothetical protein